MTHSEQRWQAVGTAIREALRTRPESFNATAKAVGLSPNKFREMRDGVPGNYRHATLVKISLGLWGEPDVIERLLAGEAPEVKPVPTVEQAIAADPDLTDQIKDIMVAFYRSALDQSRKAE